MNKRSKWFLLLPWFFSTSVQAEEIACGSVSADMEMAFIHISQCAHAMTQSERQQITDLMDAIQQQAERCVQQGQAVDVVPSPEGMNNALKNVMGNPVTRNRAAVTAACRQHTPLPVLLPRYRSLMPSQL